MSRIPVPGTRTAPRDRGLVANAGADALARASMRSRPRRERWHSTVAFLLYGERAVPIPAHRGPVEELGSTGICCSGGGIRSAAYNLGALQALQRRGKLMEADYLAAVSGGSYIAAAFCMVAKTSGRGGADQADGRTCHDSDPRLLERLAPFAPGSPEEQYLRNRSDYMAPDGAAKLYLAFRLVLGLLFNLFFLALPLVALTILAGVFVYAPAFFGGSCTPSTCAPRPPLAAWLMPAALAAAAILIGGWRLLRRAPNDLLRRFSETWVTRLLAAAAFVAVVTLALPALVDLVRPDGTVGAAERGTPAGLVGGATGAAGLAGLVAGVLACLRELGSAPRRAGGPAGRLGGRLARLRPRLRRGLVQAAAAVAGPVLVLTITVWSLATTFEQYADHRHALTIGACAALALFALLYRCADLTSWSLHGFYKRRLCTAFALRRVLPKDEPMAQRRTAIAQEDEHGIAVERDFDCLVALSETGLPHGPALVVCAAANISDPGATPPGRRVTSFTFSAHTIGGPLVGGLETERFERAFKSHHRRQRDITLPAAVAMSGAALSPSMGKSSRRSFRFLMTLANIRLGVWVPNPRWVACASRQERGRYKRPRPWYLLLELLGRNRIDARYLYVTDGGHYENLGLVELLRRGCTRIYCFDASGGNDFAQLGDAVALARSELGVEISIDPTPLTPTGTPPTATTDTVIGTFTYRGSDERCVLVYARNVVAPGAPWDVRSHQLKDPRFPHDSTADQLYTDQKFESYRALGEQAGGHAIELMASQDGLLPASRSNGHSRPEAERSRPQQPAGASHGRGSVGSSR